MCLHGCSSDLKYTKHELGAFSWYLWWSSPFSWAKHVSLRVLTKVLKKWVFWGEKTSKESLWRTIATRENKLIDTIASSIWEFIYDRDKICRAVLAPKQKTMWIIWLTSKTPDAQRHGLPHTFLQGFVLYPFGYFLPYLLVQEFKLIVDTCILNHGTPNILTPNN